MLAFWWCIIFRFWEHWRTMSLNHQWQPVMWGRKLLIGLICTILIAPTIIWGYKIQFPLQTKVIWPRSEFWGLIHHGIRVDVELFLKKNSDLPVGTSRPSRQVGGWVRFLCPFMNFYLILLEFAYESVWICFRSPAQSCFIQSSGKDRTLNRQAVIKVKWRVILFFVLYSLDLRCTDWIVILVPWCRVPAFEDIF